MVVSVYEQIWYHTHRESISNLHLHALFLRYVDNRLVILPSSTKDLPAFQILVDPDFYKAPIFLETEPDQEFLGFQVELDPLELCYQPPQDLSQVLSPICRLLLLLFFSVDLRQGVPLYTGDLFPNHKLTKVFTP